MKYIKSKSCKYNEIFKKRRKHIKVYFYTYQRKFTFLPPSPPPELPIVL